MADFPAEFAPLQMIPPRRADWRSRLAQYLAAVAHRPFRPGQHDCALFAAGAVEAMTGADLASAWRGSYRRLEDGLAALQAAGFEGLPALAAACFPEVAPALAQAGDLAVLPGDETGAALGVVQGPAVYVLDPRGLAVVSRLHMKKAFRV